MLACLHLHPHPHPVRMASPHLPEDIIRTLSRLVFACTASDQMTLRLFDPATNKLTSYLLVKVLDDDGDLYGRSPDGRSSPPLPRVNLDELMERLKAVVRQEVPTGDTHRYRASGVHGMPPSNCSSAGGSAVATIPSDDSDVLTWPCPPGRPTRQNALLAGLGFSMGGTSSLRRASGRESFTGQSRQSRGAPDCTSTARSQYPPPRLDEGTVVRADGGADKLCSAVSDVATAARGRVKTEIPARRLVDTPRARPCTPTKAKAKTHGTPHETSLPPDAIDFPPSLVTSTPRAVARDHSSLAVRHATETRVPSETDRTRHTSSPTHGPGTTLSFDLAAFDPEVVYAALKESRGRASIGVADPMVSVNWETQKLRRSTAR